LAVAVLALLAVSAADAANWNGSEETRDGVVHVLNPATPAEAPETITPEEMWRMGGDEDDEEVIFGVLTSIATDAGGNVYLLDMQLSQVYVYSADGEYLNTIGREGEGPGEFRRAGDMFIAPDGNVAVMQRMPGKIVLLSTEGDPMGEWPMPGGDDGAPMFLRGGGPAGDGLVLAMGAFKRSEQKVEITQTLARVNNAGEVVATYSEKNRTRDFANMTFDEKSDARVLWTADRDGRVYISDDFDSYAIAVFDGNGNRERVIEREYEHRKRSAEEMERNKPKVMIRRGGKRMEPETTASPTDRDVMDMQWREDGTLWVLPSHGAYTQPDGVIATWDMYDGQGRFIRQVAVRGEGSFEEDGIHFVGERMYVVRGLRSAQDAMHGDGGGGDEDAEDPGPMAVICYDLSGIVKASR
jgi:hypothetical protein